MTFRTLFTIILKVLAVFLTIDIVAVVPQLLAVAPFFTDTDSIVEGVWLLLSLLLVLAVYIGVIYHLLFKTVGSSTSSDWIRVLPNRA